MRLAVVLVVAWCAVAAVHPAAAERAAGGAVLRYRPPVPLQVLRGFEPPPTPYAAGHRGVDLAVPSDRLVHAAADGRVSFAGQVAGRGVIVLTHADGVSTEYEPVTALVRMGSVVAGGDPIGRIDGTHAGCPSGCLHWGARRAGAYLDPLRLLRALAPVRLLPWTGRVGPG